MKRAGGIYLFAKRLGERRGTPSDNELRWLVRQARQMVKETNESFRRAEHAGNKITQLLTGDPDLVWFRQAKEGMEWAEEVGLGELFETLRETFVSLEDEEKYRETIERIREILKEQENKLRAP